MHRSFDDLASTNNKKNNLDTLSLHKDKISLFLNGPTNTNQDKLVVED